MTKYELIVDYPSQSKKEELTELGQIFLDFINSNQSPGQNRHIAEMELRRRLGLRVLLNFGFLEISQFLERILMEHKEQFYSSDGEQFFFSICSKRIPSRTRDIFEKNQILKTF